MLGCPVASEGWIELQAACRLLCNNATTIKREMSTYPRLYWPTSQSAAGPRAPLRFGKLILVGDGSFHVRIDQYQIRIVAHLNASLSNYPPNSSRRVACLRSDLIPSAVSSTRSIQQESKVVFDGRKTTR